MKLIKKNQKSAKANKSAKVKAKEAKTETKTQVEAFQTINGKHVAIGPKGCALVLGNVLPSSVKIGEASNIVWASFKSAGVSARSLCDSHAKGKAMGQGLESFDAGCYVGNRGGNVTILPLKTAIAKRLVKPVKIKIDDGKKPVVGYVPSSWSKGQKAPSYIATESLPSGRVETFTVSKANPNEKTRNESLRHKVEIV